MQLSKKFHTLAHDQCLCHSGHSCLCERACGVAPNLPSHSVIQISSLEKKKKEGVGGGGRESLLKGLLHCTTSAAGRAQTHPSCQPETNEERLETIHKPHPLQGSQGLTGWKSGHTGALNAHWDSYKHTIKSSKVCRLSHLDSARHKSLSPCHACAHT